MITPFFLGMIAGAVASGRVPAEGHGDLWTSWTGPTSWVGGTLAVLTCAFLAATFLAADAQRAGDADLAAWIGRRALVCGVVTGVVAVAAIVPIELDADTLAGKLQGRGAVAARRLGHRPGSPRSGCCTAGAGRPARVGAVVAVAAIVVGWGVAQYPDLLADTLTLDDAAGARSTLIGLVITFGFAAVTAVPAMIWLFVLVNRRDWATDDAPAVEPTSSIDVVAVDAAPYSAPIRPRAGRSSFRSEVLMRPGSPLVRRVQRRSARRCGGDPRSASLRRSRSPRRRPHPGRRPVTRR